MVAQLYGDDHGDNSVDVHNDIIGNDSGCMIRQAWAIEEPASTQEPGNLSKARPK